jgi:hypothetical protein
MEGSIEKISHRLKNPCRYPKGPGQNSNPIPRGKAPRDWIGIRPWPAGWGMDFSIYDLFFRWIHIPIWYRENLTPNQNQNCNFLSYFPVPWIENKSFKYLIYTQYFKRIFNKKCFWYPNKCHNINNENTLCKKKLNYRPLENSFLCPLTKFFRQIDGEKSSNSDISPSCMDWKDPSKK